MNKDKGFNQNQEDNKEKKKKKIFWLWFLLVLVLAISISAFGFITFSSSTTPSSSSATSNSSSSGASSISSSSSETFPTLLMMHALPTSLGRFHSGSLTSEGRVFVWGLNSSSQLGDGTTTNRNKPVEITSSFDLEPSDQIESLHLGANHSSAITSLGRVFVCGLNSSSQLGDTTNRNTPTEITSRFNLVLNESVQSIHLGWISSNALTSNGRVFTWGDNGFGQLGDGTNVSQSSPADITEKFLLNASANEKITYLSSSFYGSFALTSTGRIFAWGDNLYGQLGDNTTISRNTPTDITSRFGLRSDEVVTVISGAGDEHSVAITNQNRVFTFGRNNQGQLGNGDNSITSSSIPLDITASFSFSNGETIQTLSGGASFTIITTSVGRIMSWGGNFSGQLGNGDNINQFTPINIADRFDLLNGETVQSISAGYSQSFALTSIGRLFVWGANSTSQLGDGLTANRNIPFVLTFDETTA
jgi:alpha-tubulin suppressor-like RCC1 family protein